MIMAGDFRKGMTVEIDGQVWSIADFQHVKPGKGAAFVRTRLKNVMTGAVLERTFSPTDKYPNAHIETREMQYLYNDGQLYYFMDVETYEQIPLNHDQVEDAIDFIVENENVKVRFFKGARSPSRRRTLWSSRSRTPNPACAAIPPPAPPSRQSWKPGTRSTSRCSSTRATASVWTPVPANIWSASNAAFQSNLARRIPI